ncbi:hypothetical protein F511_25628 [Dorcoceras hygrometricum]|uniref:Uncharacterized protein n=1 Tax=Dorcoceras hygrometricum TaxID=472368 RepID=A0A2Z7AID7_9LAMI|nr:hypothetical protein F511_25628 [Dorcoceras hygrometricum]
MQAHLAAQDDDMWFVNTDGLIKIMKPNTTMSRLEWMSEDKNKANLDNVTKDLLYKTLDNNMFSKIQTYVMAKEIWEKLIQIYEGNKETKENKLIVALQKFEFMKMKSGETMTEFDERFSSVVIELTRLGKEYSNRDLTLKVMRALPKEWEVKTMAMRESKDLNKLELHDLFANLKGYEFELEKRYESEPSTSQPTKILTAAIPEQSSPRKSAEDLSNDIMFLFVKKFGKFMRKNISKPNSFDAIKNNSTISSDFKCDESGRAGHYVAGFKRPN